ncbi:MAG: 2-C-methyl-D-erythritol 4-phosphate cytidylyltransferase [Candidatus Dormibacteraceae bacterium]
MEVGAVVAAAGLGTRLGLGSKALLEVNGRTLLTRALELFLELNEVGRVVVVGPPASLAEAEAEVHAVGPTTRAVRLTVCAGGDSRQESVRIGLRHLAGCDYVLVHDAARPLASAALARRVLAAALETGAAFPGVQPSDAVKRVEAQRLVESLDRSRLVLAQTPQAFGYQLLLDAHRQAQAGGLAGDDDAQLVAAIGHPVAVVEGEATNLKLTTAADLTVLLALVHELEAAGR